MGVTDVRETAVAHDTQAGVLSGRRAGAGIVAGILGGTHTGERLRQAGATHLIHGIAELPELLTGAAPPDQASPATPAATGAAADEAAQTHRPGGPGGRMAG